MPHLGRTPRTPTFCLHVFPYSGGAGICEPRNFATPSSMRQLSNAYHKQTCPFFKTLEITVTINYIGICCVWHTELLTLWPAKVLAIFFFNFLSTIYIVFHPHCFWHLTTLPLHGDQHSNVTSFCSLVNTLTPPVAKTLHIIWLIIHDEMVI